MAAFKNFGITFLISTLIFGVVAYFIVGFLTSTVSGILEEENDRLDNLITAVTDETTGNIDAPDTPVPEVKGESFTILFGVTDRRDDVFDYFPEEDDINSIKTSIEDSKGVLTKKYHTVKVKSVILVRVCRDTGEYTIIPIPSESKVYTQMGGGYTLLEDVKYFYDKEYFVQKVSAMTGITPDYTAFVNVTDMADVINEIGGFNCNLPEDIYTDGKKYIPKPDEDTANTTAETKPQDSAADTAAVKDGTDADEEIVKIEKAVSAGNVKVDGSNIEALLLYDGYSDGVRAREKVLTEIMQGLLGRLSGFDDAGLSRLYASLTKEKVETDMTEAELLSKGEIIRAYPDFTVNVSEYPGSDNSDGTFTPNVMQATKDYMNLRLPPDPDKTPG